jgi:hypothetical protein
LGVRAKYENYETDLTEETSDISHAVWIPWKSEKTFASYNGNMISNSEFDF